MLCLVSCSSDDIVIFVYKNHPQGHEFGVGRALAAQAAAKSPVHVELLYSTNGAEYGRYKPRAGAGRTEEMEVPAESIIDICEDLNDDGELPDETAQHVEQ